MNQQAPPVLPRPPAPEDRNGIRDVRYDSVQGRDQFRTKEQDDELELQNARAIGDLIQLQSNNKYLAQQSIRGRLNIGEEARYQLKAADPSMQKLGITQKHPKGSYELIESSNKMPDNFNMSSPGILDVLAHSEQVQKGTMHPLVEGFDEQRRSIYEGNSTSKQYNLVQLELRNRRLYSMYDR